MDTVGAASSARIYGGAIGNISQVNWQSGGFGYGGSIGANYGRRRETNAAYGIARSMGPMGAFKSELRQQQARIGIYNLTKDEAPALAHFGTDKTGQWLLVRVKQDE